jgi:hypothetical protein
MCALNTICIFFWVENKLWASEAPFGLCKKFFFEFCVKSLRVEWRKKNAVRQQFLYIYVAVEINKWHRLEMLNEESGCAFQHFQRAVFYIYVNDCFIYWRKMTKASVNVWWLLYLVHSQVKLQKVTYLGLKKVEHQLLQLTKNKKNLDLEESKEPFSSSMSVLRLPRRLPSPWGVPLCHCWRRARVPRPRLRRFRPWHWSRPRSLCFRRRATFRHYRAAAATQITIE